MPAHKKKIIDELCNYLGHDLDDCGCQELREHIENCPNCLEYIESIRTTVSICKEAYKEEPVPDNCKKSLLRMLEEKKLAKKSEQK